MVGNEGPAAEGPAADDPLAADAPPAADGPASDGPASDGLAVDGPALVDDPDGSGTGVGRPEDRCVGFRSTGKDGKDVDVDVEATGIVPLAGAMEANAVGVGAVGVDAKALGSMDGRVNADGVGVVVVWLGGSRSKAEVPKRCDML